MGKKEDVSVKTLVEARTLDGDKRLLTMMEHMGLGLEDIEQNVPISEGSNILVENEQVLQERNIVKYDKMTKLRILAGRAAMIAARERNDPMFRKMMIFRKKYIELKRAVLAKYGHVGLSRARMAGSRGGITGNAGKTSVRKPAMTVPMMKK